MPREVDTNELTSRIEAVLNTDGIENLVGRYFSLEESNPFAGSWFDQLGENPANEFVRDDLLALNLLDVSLGAEAIRRISGGEFDLLLARIPDKALIQELEGQLLIDATAMWRELRKIPGVGRTKASKLLSRKRPHLIPIRDGIINEVLGLGNSDWWAILPHVLRESSVVTRIDELNPHIAEYKPSTLRLLDVAIWMLGSNSRNAQKARDAAKIKRCSFPIC